MEWSGRENSPSGNFLSKPRYSSDLAPSDYHLILDPKKFLAGQSVGRDQHKTRCARLTMEFDGQLLCEDVQNLLARYEKCLKHGGYVEK